MKRLNLKWLQEKKTPKLELVPFTLEEIRAKAHEIRLSRSSNAELADQDWKQEIQDLEEAIKALETEKSSRKRVWDWVGLKDKKGWDFLQLLIVPAVLSIAAFGFQQVSKENEQKLADDRARQDTLSKYLDQMSELLINKGLRKSKPDSEVFILAQARTATALRGVDTQRQNLIIEFLHSSDLMNPKNKSGILQNAYLERANLSNTDLSEANLNNADLFRANLSGANIEDANLSNAYLYGANLSKSKLQNSNLSQADLEHADLTSTNLSFANLSGANIEDANLSNAFIPKANLNKVDLARSNLSNAYLYESNLSNARLYRANLSNTRLGRANLSGARLIRANLKNAKDLTQEQLDQAKLCGTTLPNGEISNRDCKALGIDL